MEKVKIIFLDIDGVLRPVTGEGFNKKCIENINELIEETGAQIVISSTWRQRGIDDVKKFLFENGLKSDILDMTPMFVINKVWGKDWEKQCKVKAPRGMEIQEWIRDYTTMDKYVQSYVIIDDSENIFLNQLKHYIKVEQTKGFTKKDLKKAIEILNIIDIPSF